MAQPHHPMPSQNTTGVCQCGENANNEDWRNYCKVCCKPRRFLCTRCSIYDTTTSACCGHCGAPNPYNSTTTTASTVASHNMPNSGDALLHDATNQHHAPPPPPVAFHQTQAYNPHQGYNPYNKGPPPPRPYHSHYYQPQPPPSPYHPRPHPVLAPQYKRPRQSERPPQYAYPAPYGYGNADSDHARGSSGDGRMEPIVETIVQVRPLFKTQKQKNDFLSKVSLQQLRDRTKATEVYVWAAIRSFATLGELQHLARKLCIRRCNSCTCKKIQCLQVSLLADILQDPVFGSKQDYDESAFHRFAIATVTMDETANGTMTKTKHDNMYKQILAKGLGQDIKSNARCVRVDKTHLHPLIVKYISRTRSKIATPRTKDELEEIDANLKLPALIQDGGQRYFIVPGHQDALVSHLDQGKSIASWNGMGLELVLEPEQVNTRVLCQEAPTPVVEAPMEIIPPELPTPELLQTEHQSLPELPLSELPLSQTVAEIPIEARIARLPTSSTTLPLECISSRPDNCTSSRPDNCTSSQPDNCTSTQPENCTSTQPDNCTSTRPDNCTSNRPDNCTSSQPGNCTSSRPDNCTSSRPDSCTSS